MSIRAARKITAQTVYGPWRTIEIIRGTGWLCRCVRCGSERIIKSPKLRPQFYPLCRKCCKNCGRLRSDIKFRTKFGKVCNDCRGKRIKKWKDLTGFKSKLRQWRQDRPEKSAEYSATRLILIQSSAKLFLTEQLRRKIRQHKSLAMSQDRRTKLKLTKKNKYAVSINIDDLLKLWSDQDGRCAISNMPMAHRFNDLRAASIDRINSDLPYTIENTQLVCVWANLAKGDYPNDVMIGIVAELRNHRSPGLSCTSLERQTTGND